jgi:probable F420-dependent oxidoreductase
MDFGVVIPTWGTYWADQQRISDAIRAAEDAEFHTAWFGDHITVPEYAAHLSPPEWFDALVCCIYGAGITERLRFAPDVLVLPYRNPVELAQVISTADQLSHGRITLGVGIGYLTGEFEALGVPPYRHRGAVVDEYLEVLRLLWDAQGPVSFSGRWVEFHDIVPGPSPLQHPVPVWVGGNALAAQRRAAVHGDGWHPLFPTPDAYAAGRRTIEAARTEQGKDGDFTFSYSCPTCRISVDGEELPTVASYDGVELPEDYHYAPAMPTAADGRPLLVGNAEQVTSDLRELEAAGVEHVALRLWSGDPTLGIDDWMQQLERFTDLVVPAFR